MKAIIKRPFEPVGRIVDIPNTLESLQAQVGGYIEVVTVNSYIAIICNEEGRIKDLPYNCDVCGCSFVGTIRVAGVDGEEFTDVPIDLKKWKKIIFGGLACENYRR